MLNKKFATLILLLHAFISINPQNQNEIRAVWVATNHRLDWPPATFNIELQKKALAEIFDSVKSKNLNTVFFQVRSNGTVLFKSSYEPFSYYIDANGGMPYDPLQFAIEEAHKRKLEIHAWINVVQVFAGKEFNVLNNPKHITKRKPDWIIEYGTNESKSYWLNPALPEVREYISDIIKELVENYNIDGIHLDYIRYPGKNIEDDSLYNVYNNGLSKDDWRRKNITDLIEVIRRKIKSVKPNLQLGATPIGINRNHKGMYGWQGFYEVYQDAQEWLRKGLLDYIAPQVYWSFKDKFQFDILAKDWVENSFGKKVIIGIGSYKPEVISEIEEMIEFARTIGAAGIAFFRYSSIKDYRFRNFSDSNIELVNKKNSSNNQIDSFDKKNNPEGSSSNKITKEENEDENFSYFLVPQLIKRIDYYEIIIYSEKKDEVILKGEDETGEKIIKSAIINSGKNIIEVKSNLEKYREIFLLFKSSNKLMRLKL